MVDTMPTSLQKKRVIFISDLIYKEIELRAVAENKSRSAVIRDLLRKSIHDKHSDDKKK